ncbi:MAG: DUF1499 domain-containing protein [Pararhizobium sp.]
MRIVGWLALIVLAIIVLAGSVFVVYGRERTWALLTGPNDLGRYDFAAAERRKTGNDALACSPGLCRQPDFELPTFEIPPPALIEALSRHLMAIDPRARRVDDRRDPAYARFVTFSPIMRFPDTIDLLARAAGGGRTGVLAYSRAKLGRKDFGKNREHIETLFAGFKP